MPETRTVGQLVADTIRLYGERFWRVLPLGLSVAVVDQLFQNLSREGWVLLMVTVGGLLMTASYTAACLIALGKSTDIRTWGRALLAGWVAFFPVPAYARGYAIPLILDRMRYRSLKFWVCFTHTSTSTSSADFSC